jgi:hypothetical protein
MPRHLPNRPRLRPSTVLALLALLALFFHFPSALACPVSTELSCSDVYAALVSRVKCVGSACQPRLAPAECMQHKLMRRVMAWATDAGVARLDDRSGSVAWNATCPQLADIVALSMLGRAFVATQTADAVFFEFDTGSSTLRLRPLGCEFQRPLYSVVLLTALFTLSVILASQYIQAT